MADTKVSALSAFTPILTDITYGVDDPGGTPISGKHTYQALMDLFEANMSVDLTSFTLTGTTAQFNTALSDGSFATLAGTETLTNKTITMGGTLNVNGQQIEGYLNKVVSSVSGTLTAASHAGNVLITSGNVTVPTTAGFSCILIAGGAHTVTFNSTTSAAMAAGDLMTIAVQSGTVIHAVLTAAADKVSFT